MTHTHTQINNNYKLTSITGKQNNPVYVFRCTVLALISYLTNDHIVGLIQTLYTGLKNHQRIRVKSIFLGLR